MPRFTLFLAVMLVFICCARADEVLRVPAFTAYIEPDPHGARVSGDGVSQWSDDRTHIVWFGMIHDTGSLKLSIDAKLPPGETATLRLSAGGKTFDADVTGESSTVDFGTVAIDKLGYQRFELLGIRKSGKQFPELRALVLSGDASRDAAFNQKERRGAASVHLWFPAPKDTQVEAFYNEVTARTDPIWTYYEACGWHRGYFGMQVNSPTERRIIFSVWDAGKEHDDRGKVKDEDRVKLLAKGEGVVATDFGNEGTGGHSHLVYNWKTGEPQRFLVTAKPDGDGTIYTGWYFFPDTKKWGLIASFRAPKDGSYLKGLYAFDEDWVGDNGQLQRLAEFGNQWVRTPEGKWVELTTAKFTHTGRDPDDRRDFSAGVRDGRFFLSSGGFIEDATVKYGDKFDRPPTGTAPSDIVLDSR